jgi:hypothetical protein
MPEPLESELAGVTLESDALPKDFPPGDVRRRPEAPGHLGQAAAVPTHGLHQVDNKGSLLNYEFEAGRGEALQTPAPSGPQTAPTATADGVVRIPLQHSLSRKMVTLEYHLTKSKSVKVCRRIIVCSSMVRAAPKSICGRGYKPRRRPDLVRKYLQKRGIFRHGSESPEHEIGGIPATRRK